MAVNFKFALFNLISDTYILQHHKAQEASEYIKKTVIMITFIIIYQMTKHAQSYNACS